MITDDFNFFEYFSSDENWGDLNILDWEHVYILNLIRKKMTSNGYNWPFHVNCSVEFSGHSRNSYHYVGKATDGYFKCNKNIIDQYYIIEDILNELGINNFITIGIYPDWNIPGFHIDTRGKKVRWVKHNDEYNYFQDRIEEVFKEI